MLGFEHLGPIYAQTTQIWCSGHLEIVGERAEVGREGTWVWGKVNRGMFARSQ